MTSIDDILAVERKIREDLCDVGVTEIMVPRAFFKEQIGLRTIMCDQIGRIWDVADNPIRMIFDPFALTRKRKPHADRPRD